ncbi:hypothetical protein SLE2022_396750 [Rubroshorea leprosula]
MQSIGENMIESAVGWGDLEGNLLLRIFKQLTREDLISATWFVCGWWRSVSSAILFWKDESTLELRTDVKRLSRSRNLDPSQRLKEALKCVMDCFPMSSSSHNCAPVRTILFSRAMFLLDMHINLVAKKSPKLRKLILPKAYTVTVPGLCRAIRKWEQLEELSIGPVRNLNAPSFFRVLGKTCRNLTILTLSSYCTDSSMYLRLDEINSLSLSRCVPQLRILSMDKMPIFRRGVCIILQKCKNLEKLNLSKCGRMFYDYPSIYGPGLGKLYGKEISVEIRRDKGYQSMRWFIDTLDESYTPKRGVKCLWSIGKGAFFAHKPPGSPSIDCF